MGLSLGVENETVKQLMSEKLNSDKKKDNSSPEKDRDGE